MPEMSGIELQTELQKSACPVPMIMITGQVRIDMAVSAIKRGAQDFIEKRFLPDRLIISISSRKAETRSDCVSDFRLSALQAAYNTAK